MDVSIANARKLLETHTDVKSKDSDWSAESVLLQRDEIDTGLVPERDRLSEEVLTYQYLLISSNTKKEYIVYFIKTTDNQKTLVSGIIENNSLLWHEVNL